MITRMKDFFIWMLAAFMTRLDEKIDDPLQVLEVARESATTHVFMEARTAEDRQFVRELSRLFEKNHDGEPLGVHQLDYWADRYNRLDISARAGISFKAYLQRPELVEEIAETTMPLDDRETVHANR